MCAEKDEEEGTHVEGWPGKGEQGRDASAGRRCPDGLTRGHPAPGEDPRAPSAPQRVADGQRRVRVSGPGVKMTSVATAGKAAKCAITAHPLRWGGGEGQRGPGGGATATSWWVTVRS